MKNNIKLDVVFILDKSGSMSGSEEHTISSFNEYLAKEKKNKFNTKITTVLFSHDYELQNKLKKAQEEREAEKEMSQCTFKPQLYNNKYNSRIQTQKANNKKKTIYEKQSQWLNNVKKKKRK